MTGKKLSMIGKWPGIIFVDENGHPDKSEIFKFNSF